MSNFLAKLPIEDQTKETFDSLDEEVLQVEEDIWRMYFNNASNQKGFGVCILPVSLEGAHTQIFVKLDYDITNNVAKYEASIIGI